MWAPGARFGKYKLVERLGKGGMAETWRGELLAAEGVRKAVVIKRVLPSFSDNKEFVEAFVQEAKITASLSHGNVAQVFDFGQVGDSHFIAMELIDGRSLDRVLKHGIARGYWHLPYPIATLIALEVAKGLEHVHTRRGAKGPLNIVHRDVSPDNIIVGMNGETKLVDFGVAKSVLEGAQQTEAGVLKGKYIYFSPEQAAGEQVDFRTDIYALGVVLYRLVTGRKAFDGPRLRVLQQVAAADYTPLRIANPDVPDELASVIETMMALNKENRYGSTLELVEALSHCLVQLSPRAGVHWIRDWVRWLYSEDLKKRGEEPELRTGFIDLAEGWKPRHGPPSDEAISTESKPDEMATIASRRVSQRQRATGFEEKPPEPWSTKKKLYAGLAGAGAMLVLVGFVALTTARDPYDGESEEARNQRIAEETRPKPLVQTAKPVKPSTDDENEGGGEVQPAPAPAPANPTPPVIDDDPDLKNVSFDAEVAPVTFRLTKAHQVSLDGAPELPGPGGALTDAKPLQAGALTMATAFKTKNTFTGVGSSDDSHDVPAFMFAPGRPPQLELVATGNARWSREGTRLAMLVGSSNELPGVPLGAYANGRPLRTAGMISVVEQSDRFTIQDLSTRPSWKVTVTAQPKPGEVVGPIVVFIRGGNAVRLDGKQTLGGYAILTPGTHRITGAASAWLTVPVVSPLKLAAYEVSFTK